MPMFAARLLLLPLPTGSVRIWAAAVVVNLDSLLPLPMHALYHGASAVSHMCMRWLRSLSSSNLQVSFTEYILFYKAEGSFAKETYNLKEPTNRSHPMSPTCVCVYQLSATCVCVWSAVSRMCVRVLLSPICGKVSHMCSCVCGCLSAVPRMLVCVWRWEIGCLPLECVCWCCIVPHFKSEAHLKSDTNVCKHTVAQRVKKNTQTSNKIARALAHRQRQRQSQRKNQRHSPRDRHRINDRVRVRDRDRDPHTQKHTVTSNTGKLVAANQQSSHTHIYIHTCIYIYVNV